MRDLLLTLFLAGGALYALYRPWVGAMLWTWVSLMSPHVEFGYSAATRPFGMLIAICTLVGLLFSKERQSPFVGSAMWVMLGFVLWLCITLPFSFYLEESFPLFVRSMKIFLMLYVTAALIDTRQKVCVVSVGYYGFKGGLFTVATGGSYRVWGPAGFIEGNNELAVALLMCIPWIRFLQTQMTNLWVRRGMLLWMLLTAAAVIGTYSRGALVGLGVMALFLWAKGDRKILWGCLLTLGVIVALPLMPESWWDRMGTIQTYEQDASAMGRINAWTMAFNLANDRLVGGGFAVAKPDVFAKYAPVPDLFLAAHSIYFQILGEHGWIGLLFFVSVGLSGWLTARRVIRRANGDPEFQWAIDLAKMSQVSLVGFAAGGAFLSLAYFDMPYNIVMVMALTECLCLRALALRATTEATLVARTSDALGARPLLRQ